MLIISSLMVERNYQFYFIFLCFITITNSYLLLVNDSQNIGDIIFNSSLYRLGDRSYKIDEKRSAPFVKSLININKNNGQITLNNNLYCNGLYYPNLFTIHIDSTNNRLTNIDYYTLPLKLFIIGEKCIKNNNNIKEQINNAKQWITETYASYAIPTTDKWQKICLRQSQFINSLTSFIPKTIKEYCKIEYHYVSDERFKIEHSQGDLVASRNVCIIEPLWKVTILFSINCNNNNNNNIQIINNEHRLKIVYHHQIFNDTDLAKRVRRELRNQSPFFEKPLYIASVLEECDPGVIVTTVKARDPENNPITYSMTSLLDSRTQSMFDIDEKTGVIITKVKLDRELVDVHYFRVTANEESFPPRSGTTMLQINVLDANDHSPIFEMNEYDANVKESVTIGTTVISLKATDQDIGKNAEVEYNIVSINGGGITTNDDDKKSFKIDEKTGIITTRTILDRELTEIYTLIISATDQATPQTSRRSSTSTVIIHILDDNDNYPQFSERTYTITLNEDIDWTTNPIIAHIHATDADQGNNAAIRYAIISGNTQSQFSIDSLTGDVILNKQLDYETIRNYRLVIRAQDGGSPTRSNTTQLLINIKDINDNSPRFYTSLFQENIQENAPTGYSIVKVQAYDADEGLNADIKYSIEFKDLININEFPLKIDSHNGWITTTKELDREEQSKFIFNVIATDQGIPAQSASASVIINVQDINDNDPIFEQKIYEAIISEDDPPGTPVATVIATDPDEDNRLHYELTNGNIRGRFTITTQNGRGLITIAQPLDYKQEKRYILSVTATDNGGRTDSTTIYINITDANNFAPIFENAPYSTSIFEDVKIGTTVLVVTAIDNDVGINAQITYSLNNDNDNDNNPFTINPQTGAIITTKLLDREKINGYLLTVTAKDGGNPPLSDTTDIEISISDVNDNYPIFKQATYFGNVLEDALIGTSVVQVIATDYDIGLNGRIRYTLSEKDQDDGSFVIDPTSGVIRTNKGLDRESISIYELEAYAIDRGTPTLSSSVPVTIRIDDINDSPPAFDTDKILLYISENSPIGSTVGEIYAKDPDEGINALVQYSIIGGDDSQSFSLITRPGNEKADLITMIELDYESSKKIYNIIIRAASPPLRSDVHVEIIVTDVNDNAPILNDFYILFNNFKDYFPTGPIGRIPAYDADITDKLKYKILSGNNANLISINETTGYIQLSPQLNTNVPKIASMEISVTDGINEIKAIMMLSVRLITEEMLYNSITIRLNQMTKEAFLSPLLNFFIDALAAIIPCPKDNIFIFSIQNDNDINNNNNILNVSFSIKRPDLPKENYYTSQFLKEKIYLNRAILERLSTVQILPFDDNLCVREPCLNYEECLTVLKFANASGFINSNTVLFRPIYPITTFTCQCPKGFTGSKEHYLCDTEVNLCYSSPCQNNGTCKIKEGGYTCVCNNGFTGDNCQIQLSKDTCNTNLQCKTGTTACNPKNDKGNFICEECSLVDTMEYYTPLCELKTRSFTKYAFLTFPSLKNRHRLYIKLRFATQNKNGLLLYNGRYNEQHDFIALEIINNKIQFSFSLGSNVTKATASIPGGVADGNWHSVTVSYFNKSVIVSIDECDTALALKHGNELGGKWNCAGYAEYKLEPRCALLTETCHRFLDLTGPLQLGGLPSLSENFQTKNRYYDGCISDLEIDYKFIDLNNFVTDNGTNSGCPEKRSFCSSEPCKNGGTCIDNWKMYKCICPDNYGGKDCGELIGKPWHFAGDGTLSFNPLLRPIQLPWLNALSIRTLQSDTFLMSIQVGQNSSVVISLQNGWLLYSYNGQSLILNEKDLSDGEWHHLEITWLGTEIKLSIDYGEFNLIAPFTEKVQGLFVGKILIGGPDNTYSSLNAGFNYLEGCIQDVRIGKEQTTLNRPTVKENVEDGCPSIIDCQSDCPNNSECIIKWQNSQCNCNKGYVGPLCVPICTLNPCKSGICIKDDNSLKGYHCKCNNETESGEYCEIKMSQPCPSSWWGYPVCGPCNCNIDAGYNPDCNKKTGQCYCRENHYQPNGITKCIPCDCYHIGSYGTQCNHENGQCKCRDGVIGQKCDSCPNIYAEVTNMGCEVIYDGCPRNSLNNIWWPRTNYGNEAIENCPKGSYGKASRLCDNELGKWLDANLFNCTTEKFLDLREQLSNLENGILQLNTFVSIKLASDLYKATNITTTKLYGADILIIFDLIKELINYELNMNGLNLTHSQDKDYIYNLVHSLGYVLDEKYKNEWNKIIELTGHGVNYIIGLIENYINILSISQHDTYTNPFEIVSSNMILGLDIVTPESLYGYESELIQLNDPTYTTEKVILPDTSQFLQQIPSGPLITFPKYNNYLLDKNKFDQNSKILIPLNLLGIKPIEIGELITKHSLSDSGAVISYAQYKEAGLLFPNNYDESVVRRWGIDIIVGSPLISISVLVPEYVDAIEKTTTTTEKTIIFENIKTPDIVLNNKNDEWLKRILPLDVKYHENDSKFSKRIQKRNTKKLMYKSLSGVVLKLPIRLEIALNSNKTIFNERSNPQCVHWSNNEWSRVGCRTEINENWYENIPIIVNCSCNHLTTFAVLIDIVDLEYIPEPSLLENVTSYSCFALSLPLLFITYLILAFIRGLQTNSNTIRKNLVLCVFLGELLYFISLKIRKLLLTIDLCCKLIAISLHYLWLASFFWMLIDALHLYRMLTEMRDINHGSMWFYYTMGYVLPAIVVSLSVGVRAHQYGNYYFCWLSLYESVIWSLIGPICLLVIINLFVLILAIRAAFTLKDHVLGFGNLRTLLWVSVVSLPLLGATWLLALLNSSERHPLLTPLLSGAVLIHSIFSLIGYCFANNRVRQNLINTIMRCMGKKIPLLDTQSSIIGGIPSNSNQNINNNIQSRSALAYHSNIDPTTRRNNNNIGISTSSTTSRSTTKTSSSPYRSDAHLRHTSTSTSNYNSTSDVPSYMRGFDNEHHNMILHRHRELSEDQKHQTTTTTIIRRRDNNNTDSDSDGSEGRSLDLASSHSSDDDESSTRRNNRNKGNHRQAGYLPNITEHVISRCGTPPSLNVVTNSQLFPSVPTNYGSRWSSQLPESYLPSNEVGRWSAETGSDNEYINKTNSPNPLPNPDVTPETCLPTLQSEQYMVRAHYDNNYTGGYKSGSYISKMMHQDNMNFQEYERGSDIDDKHHMNDKYLFPYTAEEDHVTAHNNYMHPNSRMMSPITNDINNPGVDYHGSHMGSRIGSVLGSIHGSVCGSIRGSPSPLVPPVSMLHSSHHPPEPPTQAEEKNEETSV